MTDWFNLEDEDHYYRAWKFHEKLKSPLAEFYKEKYRKIKIAKLQKPYNQYEEKLKRFPMLNLN